MGRSKQKGPRPRRSSFSGQASSSSPDSMSISKARNFAVFIGLFILMVCVYIPRSLKVQSPVTQSNSSIQPGTPSSAPRSPLQNVASSLYPSLKVLRNDHAFFTQATRALKASAALHPIIEFPTPPEPMKLDSPDSVPPTPCTIFQKVTKQCKYFVGGYFEKRFLYTTPLFTSATAVLPPVQNESHYIYGGKRNVHVGVDVMCPAGVNIYAPTDGVVLFAGYNDAEGDYGGVVITKHDLADSGSSLRAFYVLYGHLNKLDAASWASGAPISKGGVVARVGKKSENGGWEPHLHLQVQLTEPTVRDMPGVVAEVDEERALLEFPDPTVLLGL